MSGDSPAELGRQLDELRERLSQVESKVGKGQVERLSLVVFSGSLDRQIAAFTIATAAAASGMEVDMFFTFWGFSALRDPGKRGQGTPKPLLARMFGWMLPRGSRQLPPRPNRRRMTTKTTPSTRRRRSPSGNNRSS